MTTITDNQRNFTEALMLAIVAPDEDKSKKAVELATRIGATLDEDEQELCKLGIETCLEYMRKYP